MENIKAKRGQLGGVSAGIFTFRSARKVVGESNDNVKKSHYQYL